MSEGKQETPIDSVRTGLAKVLSSHGHGFHYAIMRRADQLLNEKKSPWILQATEFPVSVQGQVTHVDFILNARDSSTFLVAECKRADPARGLWSFVAAPYRWRNRKEGELVFEEIRLERGDHRYAHSRIARTTRGSYDLGVELRTSEKGEGITSGSAIEGAVAQVLRGTNGWIDYLHGDRGFVEETQTPNRFLPVIFTTADILTSPVDLGEAEIQTGRVSVEEVSRQPWVWLTHNQSRELRHSVPRRDGSIDLSLSIRNEFTRTIAVVGTSGIDAFLCTDPDVWFE